ncbi:MAG: zf-HC2 domain-containing protein [Desulfotomaculales bacterium]
MSTLCYNEGILQAYLDGEVSRRRAARIDRHLARCPRCRRLAATLRENEASVTGCLERYAAAAGGEGVPEAWRQFSSRFITVSKNEKGASGMRSKKLWAAVAAAAALVIAFSFGPVRGLAGEFLHIFRVERFQVINITRQDMAQIEHVLERGGTIDLASFGQVSVSGEQKERAVTLAEAQEAVDFPVRLPTRLPAGYGLRELHLVIPPAATFSLQVENVNAFLRSLGATNLLPADLEGKTFTIKGYPAVAATYNTDGRTVLVVQSRSPELIVPPGVDMAAVRDALLNIPGLPDNLRRQLAAISDWQHTLPVPGVKGAGTEVTVNGAPGVFVAPPDAGGYGQSHLLWQQHGVLYTISGPISLSQALDIAASMR